MEGSANAPSCAPRYPGRTGEENESAGGSGTGHRLSRSGKQNGRTLPRGTSAWSMRSADMPPTSLVELFADTGEECWPTRKNGNVSWLTGLGSIRQRFAYRPPSCRCNEGLTSLPASSERREVVSCERGEQARTRRGSDLNGAEAVGPALELWRLFPPTWLTVPRTCQEAHRCRRRGRRGLRRAQSTQ